MAASRVGDSMTGKDEPEGDTAGGPHAAGMVSAAPVGALLGSSSASSSSGAGEAASPASDGGDVIGDDSCSAGTDGLRPCASSGEEAIANLVFGVMRGGRQASAPYEAKGK